MHWLSIHFYPLETQDVFLARAVKPFLEHYIWPQKTNRAFFIRYQDEKGPHIRLRMRGEADWVENTLKEAFAGWFRDRGEWQEVPYVPEPERFGGGEALAWAEEHFHVSTHVTLDRIARDQFTYSDGMFDALRLNLTIAFAAGLDQKKTRWYFDQLTEQWLSLFFAAETDAEKTEIKESFAASLEGQKDSLNEALTGFRNMLEEGKTDSMEPEWLRWLRGNQLIMEGLADKMEMALPSLIHLTNNRMGIHNQDEVYLNYILSQVL